MTPEEERAARERLKQLERLEELERLEAEEAKSATLSNMLGGEEATMSAVYSDGSPMDVENDSIWSIMGKNLKNAVVQAPIETAKTAAMTVGGGVGGKVGATAMKIPWVASAAAKLPFAGRVFGLGAETLGSAVGSEAGEQAVDQPLQLSGLTEDTPFGDDMAKSGWDTAESAGLGMLLHPALKTAGWAAGKMARRGDAIYGPRAKVDALAGAFDDGSMSGDPMKQAEARGATARLGSLVDDPAVAGSDKPFTELDRRISGNMSSNTATRQLERAGGELNRAGEEINAMLRPEVTPGTVPVRSVLNADAVVSRMQSGGASGTALTQARNILRREWDAQAQRVLGEDGFEEFQDLTRRARSLRTRERLATRRQGGAFSDNDAAELATIDNDIATMRNTVDDAPLNATEVHELNMQYDELSRFDADAIRDPSVAAAFRGIASSAREAKYSLTDATAHGARFRDVNQRFQDLKTLEGSTARLAGAEGNTPTELLPRPRVVVGPKGTPSVYLTSRDLGNKMPENQKRLRIGTGALTGMQMADRAAGATAAGVKAGVGPVTGPVIATAATMLEHRNDNPSNKHLSKITGVTPTTHPALSQSFLPPTENERPGFQIPRSLNAIDPEGISRLLRGNLPPERYDPIQLQFSKVVASGDKEMLATFLTAIAEQFPDFPFQRGQVTGLSSEWDVGDGRARLYSDADKMRWENEIEKSPLATDEKAQRILALRKDGIVVPMTLQVAPPREQRIQAGRSPATQHFLATNPMSPRKKTRLGSRKVE